MDWIIAGIIGWCGTGWPIHFRGGGGGGVEPGDWGPPGCIVCGPILGIIGGIANVAIFGSHFTNMGMGGMAILAFFGGSFLASLGGMVMGMVKKG
ncbi:MAG: hypothetical protein KGL13_09220 [Gammaproteobacteria bacterium]|nr:hypothetical protein [Gammaproteobacteria bacterium]MDE2346635.1 hypothetical protein [Gammaproteobacteria bacterium]